MIHAIEISDHFSFAEKCLMEDYPTVTSCLLSLRFWLLTFWFSTLQLRIHSYVGIFNPFFTQITGGSHELGKII